MNEINSGNSTWPLRGNGRSTVVNSAIDQLALCLVGSLSEPAFQTSPLEASVFNPPTERLKAKANSVRMKKELILSFFLDPCIYLNDLFFDI